MCGHAGFIRMEKENGITSRGYSIFVHLSILAQLRGFDSSGVSLFWRQQGKKNYAQKKKRTNNRRGWMSYKDLVDPVSCINTCLGGIFNHHYNDKMDKKYEKPELFAGLFHARAATKGEVTKDNAHPFRFGNNRFIGAHNGTINNARVVFNKLKNTEPLPNTTKHEKDYGFFNTDVTDSEIVLYCIYRWGIDAVYPLIEGAWAFVWYDEQAGSINFIRNYARPLWYYTSYIQNALFYVSEKEMLEFAINRTAAVNHKLDPDRLKEFDVHKLYSADIKNPDAKAIKHDKPEFPWTEVRDLGNLLVKSYNSGDSGYSNTHGWWDYEDEYEPKSEEKKSNVIVTKKFKQNKSARKIKDVLANKQELVQLEYCPVQKRVVPVDEMIPLEELDNTDDYCLWCIDPIDENNDEYSLQIKGSGVVCGKCANKYDEVVEIIDAYPQCSDDLLWIKRFTELDDEEKKAASNMK